MRRATPNPYVNLVGLEKKPYGVEEGDKIIIIILILILLLIISSPQACGWRVGAVRKLELLVFVLEGIGSVVAVRKGMVSMYLKRV